jgi:hypothetical protein
MNAVEKYSKEKLVQEIFDIQTSNRNSELTDLDVYEKALIYKYSSDGYADVNETLRKSKGEKNTEFGKYLNKVLDKLPNFNRLVYRSAILTKKEHQRYSNALRDNQLIKEYSFVSASKSRLIAMAFNGSTLFRIYSRTGKEIEKIAKFGEHGSPNEKEILFKPNRNFRILEIIKESTYTLITMEEI